jgi:hypothetical protein
LIKSIVSEKNIVCNNYLDHCLSWLGHDPFWTVTFLDEYFIKWRFKTQHKARTKSLFEKGSGTTIKGIKL